MYCDNSRFIHWNTIYNHTSHLNWILLTRWHNMFYPIFVCYGSTTSRPYPARSLPARIWHRCTDEVFVWAPTQPIIDKDLAEPRFEPGSPSWESDALTTTPQAFAFISDVFVLNTCFINLLLTTMKSVGSLKYHPNFLMIFKFT